MNFSLMPLAAILKFQTSNLRFGGFLDFEICDLELLWILELGSWSFSHEDLPC